jgi:hypothetical protein
MHTVHFNNTTYQIDPEKRSIAYTDAQGKQRLLREWGLEIDRDSHYLLSKWSDHRLDADGDPVYPGDAEHFPVTQAEYNYFSVIKMDELDQVKQEINGKCGRKFGFACYNYAGDFVHPISFTSNVQPPSTAQATDGNIQLLITHADEQKTKQYSIDAGNTWSDTPRFSGLSKGSYTLLVRYKDTYMRPGTLATAKPQTIAL